MSLKMVLAAEHWQEILDVLNAGEMPPEVVDQLRTLYDQWWTRMQPGLVNEDAYDAAEVINK